MLRRRGHGDLGINNAASNGVQEDSPGVEGRFPRTVEGIEGSSSGFDSEVEAALCSEERKEIGDAMDGESEPSAEGGVGYRQKASFSFEILLSPRCAIVSCFNHQRPSTNEMNYDEFFYYAEAIEAEQENKSQLS
ncbi:hypothetical protein ZIOFF_068574 [Zingiber officinale]|uniref:Uncharacterized protein n=1 Tax=Zingiber officinale TaxID=94328 RepID=A0A8J5CH52_ZINOF|nr:hypothetical protein ZIOFF_068574 [Zingiber officinale]